jgi:hypothetical protein
MFSALPPEADIRRAGWWSASCLERKSPLTAAQSTA